MREGCVPLRRTSRLDAPPHASISFQAQPSSSSTAVTMQGRFVRFEVSCFVKDENGEKDTSIGYYYCKPLRLLKTVLKHGVFHVSAHSFTMF